MNAAPPAALPLPADLAAALGVGPVLVADPRTGAEFRVVRDDETGGDDDGRPPTAAEAAAIDGGQTDLEAIRDGLAQADAGELISVARFRAEMERRHPRLRRG